MAMGTPATESMRLTTRLMQIASWLLLQRAVNEGENAQRGFIYHLIRARGYKFIDGYADQLGYGSQKFGASITAIIDPMVSGVKRIRCFPDLEEAAEFLTWKRARA